MKTLFDGLRNVDTTVLPILPANLPAQDRVANSERYIIGPASLAKFIPAIPPSVAAFHYGAEGQLGVFHSPKGDMANGDFQLSDAADRDAEGARIQGNTRWQCCQTHLAPSLRWCCLRRTRMPPNGCFHR